MATGRTKGPRCGIENCRSTRYEEGDDGYLYCENGHRKGGLVVGQDDDFFSAARRTTTRKRRDDEGRDKLYQYFKGQEAVDLYLKSLQLILRHQIWFLVHDKGLPAELENVVQDLWALRILQLEERVSNVQRYESSQEFSSLGDESESEPERKPRPKGKKLKETPNLIDCLALCYLGMITLRLPITPGDIHAWVTDQRMAYYRAIRHLPPKMKDKLPAHYHAALDPNSVLKYERFHTTTTDLVISLTKEYGIVWPKLNHPLLLFRYLKDLALPLELYDATTRLAGYLNYDFTFPTSQKAKLGIRYYPEAQLLACIIVCTKLMYPFEGPKRYPKTASEPAATLIDWEKWHEQMAAPRKNTEDGVKAYTSEELIKLQEKEVFSMKGDQLDQYLDWYQNSFIDESGIEPKKDREYRNALYKMFPIDREPGSRPVTPPLGLTHKDKLEVVKAVHATFKPRRVVDEDSERNEGVVRPGQKYKHYKTVEDLPEHAKQFYEEAAKIAGLSPEMLVMAVFFAEKKMEKWQKKQKQTLA